MKLDDARRATAIERADSVREEAEYLRSKAVALEAFAKSIERTWMIPPPCHLCGRRECSH